MFQSFNFQVIFRFRFQFPGLEKAVQVTGFKFSKISSGAFLTQGLKFRNTFRFSNPMSYLVAGSCAFQSRPRAVTLVGIACCRWRRTLRVLMR